MCLGWGRWVGGHSIDHISLQTLRCSATRIGMTLMVGVADAIHRCLTLSCEELREGIHLNRAQGFCTASRHHVLAHSAVFQSSGVGVVQLALRGCRGAPRYVRVPRPAYRGYAEEPQVPQMQHLMRWKRPRAPTLYSTPKLRSSALLILLRREERVLAEYGVCERGARKTFHQGGSATGLK